MPAMTTFCKIFLYASFIALAVRFGWMAIQDGRHPDANGMVPSLNVFTFLQLAMMFAAFTYLMERVP